MGIMDMVNKAKANLKSGQDADFLIKDQKGEILIHSFTFYETDKGKWAALQGEIAKVAGKTTGSVTQPVGTRIKVVHKCHGDYPLIGYEGVLKTVKAIFDPSDDSDLQAAMRACFGSDESGLSNRASAEDRANPFFGARGVLVGFSTKETKNAEQRRAAGKTVFLDVSYSHVEQTLEEIAARAAKLPEIK
jgi:hypothetical protein